MEIDPVVLKLANEEFGLGEIDGLEIIEDDAFKYIQSCQHYFDLVIIDICIDDKVPNLLFEENIWIDIQRVIKPGGKFLFNAGLFANLNDEIDNLIPCLNQFFFLQRMDVIRERNTLIVGQKK